MIAYESRQSNAISIRESARDIPVREVVDVLVAGGGLGGVSAAVAAARAGARTLLIERNSFVGGVATAGMCCSIFNCYYTGGSERRLGTTGVAVEIADALAAAEGYGRAWRRHKGHIIYDIERAKMVLMELVEQAGAEVLLGTVVSGAVIDGNVLRGVVVESKSGREAVLAKVVIDATGDADVAARAGAPVHIQQKGRHSLCFRMGNVNVDRFIRYFREHPEEYPEYMDVEWSLDEALAQYDECGTFLFPHHGGMLLTAFRQAKADGHLPERVGLHDTTDACQMHAIRRTSVVHVVTGYTTFDGLDIRTMTQSINDGRRMVFTVADVFRDYISGFENSYVAGTAANLGVRTSRYLDGDFVLTAEMMAPGVRFDDAIGRAIGWDNPPRDREKKIGGQTLRADSFDIPYRCLLPRRVDGLLMGAGRSVSAENPYLLRVMVHTMVVGQGAGVAAALSCRQGVPPRDVDIADVQGELRRQGVDLG